MHASGHRLITTVTLQQSGKETPEVEPFEHHMFLQRCAVNVSRAKLTIDPEGGSGGARGRINRISIVKSEMDNLQ